MGEPFPQIISATTISPGRETTARTLGASNSIDRVASKAVVSAPEHSELSAEFASRPRSDMRKIVRHLGMIHLPALANGALPEPDWLKADDFPDLVGYWPKLAAGPRVDTDPVDWYRNILANLIDLLKSEPPDVE